MAHDDEALGSGSIDPAVVRNSAPATAASRADSVSSADIHDDDALADALAAQYTSLATSAIPIVTNAGAGGGQTTGDDWLSWMADEADDTDQFEEPVAAIVDAPLAEAVEPTPAEPVETTPVDASDLVDAVAPDAVVPDFDRSVVTELNAADSVAADSIAADSITVDPAAADSAVADSVLAEPVVLEPVVLEPVVSASVVSEPAITEPRAEVPDAVAMPFVSPFDPPTSAAGDADLATAPWRLFPAPDPSQAVDLPDGPPQFLAPSEVEDWPAPNFDEPAPGTTAVDAPGVVSRPITEPIGASAGGVPSAPEAGADDTASGPVSAPGLVSEIPSWQEPQPIAETPEEPLSDPAQDADHVAESDDDSDADQEQFPWITAAAAAATLPQAATLLTRDPFSWSITPTGKVSHSDDEELDDEELDDGEEQSEAEQDDEEEGNSAEQPVVSEAAASQTPASQTPASQTPAEQPATEPSVDEDSANPDSTHPQPEFVEEPASPSESDASSDVDDAQRMFSPPPLVEPLSPPPYVPPVAGLPSAPPAYFSVGSLQETVEREAQWSPIDADDPSEQATPEQTPPESALPVSAPAEPAPAEAVFVVPLPTLAGGPVPNTRDSITLIGQSYEQELDDDVDDTDRAFGALLAEGAISAAPVGAAAVPSGPISTARITASEPVFFSNEPSNPGVFSLEHSGLEPTPVEIRAGRAVRLFWLWFSAQSSVISVALGAVVFAAGMSLRQSIVGILGGVALSLFPLALSTLAGKRSAQPTMVVSRATFGLVGNTAPAVLAVISRVFWGAVLLWLLATSVAAVTAVGTSADLRPASLVTLVVAFLLAAVVAYMGFPLLARIQLVLTVVSGVLIIGVIALTARYIDIPRALTIGDGSWVLALGGSVLVFSVVGLVWAHSGADLARYQRPSSGGASSMLASTFGAAIPAFALITYGAILAASDPTISTGLATQPVETLAGLLPSWYPVPLIAAIALSLLSGVMIAMYSGGLALQSVGVKLTRRWSAVATGVALAAIAIVMVITATSGIGDIFRDFATTMAVPTAAWIGILGSEMMIRQRRFDSGSLLKRGGVYPDIRWVNLAGFAVISIIGFGLTTATVSWLSWQGYVFSIVGLPLGGEVASTDLGVIVALALGIILPLATGIPEIRRQELVRV